MTPSYADGEDDQLSATNHLVDAPLKVSAGLFVGQSILISDVSKIGKAILKRYIFKPHVILK
jgi:hypothetical protein